MADEVEKQEEVTDRREQLEAAFTEAEKPAEAAAETDVSRETPTESQAPAETPQDGAERQEAAPSEEAQPEKAAEPAAEAIEAPEHWALEHQEMFRGLTPEAQSFLMDRSKDMEAAHTKRSQEIAPLRNTVEKWQPYLQSMGAPADRVVDSLMQYEYGLRTGTNEQKMNILLGLARDYGVNFAQNGNGKPAPTADEDPFGIHAQIQQAVNPITQQIQQLQGTFQQQTTSQQQAQVTSAQQTIDRFRDEKGANGKLAHPYYQEVEQDMFGMAQAKQAAGQPLDIAQLYEQACWSNASVRAKMQAAERFKVSRSEQQRAARAKTAAGSLAGGAGAASTDQPKSRRETLERSWDEVSA